MTFYKLTPDDWLSAVQQLKLRELKVLYYLRSIFPFQEGELEVDIYRLAARLQMHYKSVERAIRRLEQDGFIGMKLKVVKITIADPDSLLSDDEYGAEIDPSQEPNGSQKGTEWFPERNQMVPKKEPNGSQLDLSSVSLGTEWFPKRNQMVPKKEPNDSRQEPNGSFLDLKPAQGKGFQPHRSNRSKDLKKERERTPKKSESFPQAEFTEWLTRKANQLPRRPSMLSSWIAAQAKKPEVVAEFLAWHERSQPVPLSPFPAIGAIGPADDDWQLNQLRSEWAIGTDATRSAMADQLARHPKYKIGDRGPERRES